MDTAEIDEMIQAYVRYERTRDAALEMRAILVEIAREGYLEDLVSRRMHSNEQDCLDRTLALLARIDG